MINFSKLKQGSFAGNALRSLLKIIPKGAVLPIVQGPLRGYKWVVRSGVFGYWLGSYEFEKQTQFASLVREGDTVYDLGAHVGFYSLLASKLTGRNGHVFSFEPFPQNITSFKRHISLNRIENIKLFEAGVSRKSGEAFFENAGSSSVGKISSVSGIHIGLVSIDELIAKHEILPPKVIKMDIEGAEYDALRGAEQTLQTYAPAILFATHSGQLRSDCIGFLEGLGYSVKPVSSGKSVEEEDEFIATKS